MPPGRPPGSSPVSVRLRHVLLWTLLVPAFAAALQQQPHDAYPSPAADLDTAASVQRRYDEAADSLNTQLSGQRGYRDTYPHKVRTSLSERALATLSPAESHPAVRAPPAQSVSTAGPISRQPARSLQDWQVEDIILLATVDGSIHARDRTNFAPKWQLESDKPMVETVYHRTNKSVDENGLEQEDPLWIVEPSQDGDVYMYAPVPGRVGMQMKRLGLTVKQLAELAPYASEGPPAVAYTAEKKTTLYTVDAGSGNILKMFSSAGSMTNNDRSCRRVNLLEDSNEDDECERTGTLTLGRTEYIIGIQDRDSGEQISTIKYFEWAPNNRDQDLQRTYKNTLDQKYVYTRHDGTVFRPARSNENRPASLHHKFSSPVARVFDVIRPSDDVSDDISLVVLPQPTAPRISDPLEDEDATPSVFVNCTAAGSWYALSDINYPDITHEAPTAKCYLDTHLPRLPLARRERKIFMGVHPVATSDQMPSTPILGSPDYLGLEAPPQESNTESSHSIDSLSPPPKDVPSMLALISLSVMLGLVAAGWYGQRKGFLDLKFPVTFAVPAKMNTVAVAPPMTEQSEVAEKPMLRDAEPAQETIFAHTRDRSDTSATPPDDDEDYEQVEVNDAVKAIEAGDTAETPKKKKATRGRRGGRKQKEKDAAAAELRGKNSKKVQVVEPGGVISVSASESPQVAGSLQINSLVINTDKVIGQGSCGTSVYEGSFEGRAVAVKRMLSQYYELASQEVSFLQQSDDHENVIRYYCQQRDDHFLYIAVELCQASLFEVWEAEKARTEERQQQLRALKLEIQKDIPRNLYQLAKGLRHLHKLRIIHRDIKPQNILVAFPKRYVDTGPRMVISDFGLGKNLPENVSTLIDPTGNAGTSGWKAPELISQPRETESKHSQSGSVNGTNNSESATNGTTSGVKRAADIFSLGCLFFWMLTDGIHPFEDDNGWTQLRELNIKRDHKKMEVLERWSDAYEPMQLITSMLEHEPENRPTALQVLNHPFFWAAEKRLAFLCDVSDHFEREPRGTCDDYYAGDSLHLQLLESRAREVIGFPTNFLAMLDRSFVETLGKQRKYSGDRLLDLLRALRNKKNHYEDMPEDVKKRVGPLAGGYLTFWMSRFPRLLMACYEVVHECRIEGNDRFRGYFEGSS